MRVRDQAAGSTSLRAHVGVLALLLVVLGALGGCSRRQPPTSNDSSPPKLPAPVGSVRPPVALTLETADEFLRWVAMVPISQKQTIRQQIAAAAADSRVVDALTNRLLKFPVTDHTRHLMILSTLGEIRSPRAIPSLKQFIWYDKDMFSEVASGPSTGVKTSYFQYNGSSEADSETGRFLAEDRTNLHCPLFNLGGGSDDVTNRASVMLHESWHHWQHAHGFDTSHPQCRGHDCDYYYFHTVSQFDFGALDRYDTNPSHLLFHSPYQIAVEFDADVAELSQGWVPVSVEQSARNYGNNRLSSQFVNSPGYTIGNPRPW
jgi:hypothetical protein